MARRACAARRVRADELVHPVHIPQILKHQDKTVAGLVEIAIQQGGKPNMDVGRELAKAAELSLIHGEHLGYAEAFLVGTGQFDDDGFGSLSGRVAISNRAAHDFTQGS